MPLSRFPRTIRCVLAALFGLAAAAAWAQSGLPTLPGQGAAPRPQQQPPAPPPAQPHGQPQMPVPGLAAPVPAAGGFDAAAERATAEVYPPEQREGPEYTIADPVVPSPSPTALGSWNRTSIQSRFGNIEAPNESFARIRAREIQAIAKLKAIDTGETVAGGVANAAMAPVRAVGALLTSPVETLGNIPKGVGDFVGRTQEGFSSDKSKFEDGMFKEIAGVSRKKREIAAQQGVDVYSSNALLQSELDRVGLASAGGNVTVDVAMIAVTGTAGAVIGNLGRVDALQEIVNTQPASELRRRARFTLENMAMPKSFVDKFLDHPYYSPRRKTIIAGLMSPMKAVGGLEKFLEAALTATSEADALYYQQMLELFSSFHFTVAPLREVALVEQTPVAISDAAGALIALPVDRVYWTAEAQALADKLVAGIAAANQGKPPLPGVNLWVLGDYTPRAIEEIARRGIKASQRAQVNYN